LTELSVMSLQVLADQLAEGGIDVAVIHRGSSNEEKKVMTSCRMKIVLMTDVSWHR
jgi:hypothetical protein